MDKILTFLDVYGGAFRGASPEYKLAAFVRRFCASSGEIRPGNGSVSARINHGRWIADCPSGDSGAILAEPTAPWFFCPSCRNRSHDSRWLKVIFPADRAQIEAVLMVRPIINRNWGPGESVEMLLADNREHGVGG